MEETKESRFIQEAFLGYFSEESCFPYPELDKAAEAEIQLILDAIRSFAKEQLDAAKFDRDSHVPAATLEAMAEMGLFGLIIPKAYGGFGLSQTAYARIVQELVRYDSSASIAAIAHQSIGMKALLLFGNDQQKAHYLPQLASGKMLAAFALTEPQAGSDAYAIRTRAELSADGQHYILNGEKIWITNGGIAHFFTVFAKTKIDGKDKITAFIVERNMPGFSSGKEEHKMGLRGSSTTPLSFVDVKVPLANVIGEPGKGFKIAMTVLNSGRLGLGASCIGGIKQLLQLATQHALERKQFDKPIAEYGLIQEKIGRMMVDAFALESMVFLVTGMVDAKSGDCALEAAACKIFGSEAMWRAANEALQIAGGAGYMQEYPYERMLRDARIMTIFEGTNEILRCFIALTGLQSVGEHLKVIGDALQAPIKSFGLLVAEVLHKVTNDSAKLTLVASELQNEAQMVEQAIKKLQSASEKVIMKYKKEIRTKQFLQKRLADLAIDLLAMVGCLSRTTMLLKNQKSQATASLQLCRTFCAEANQRIHQRLQIMDENNDEGLKQAAQMAYQNSGYPFDIF